MNFVTHKNDITEKNRKFDRFFSPNFVWPSYYYQYTVGKKVLEHSAPVSCKDLIQMVVRITPDRELYLLYLMKVFEEIVSFVHVENNFFFKHHEIVEKKVPIRFDDRKSQVISFV